MESLGKMGLIHPVVVSRLPGSFTKYVLVAGRRRLDAAKALGWSRIEARIVEPSGHLDVESLSRVLSEEENLRRRPQAAAVRTVLQGRRSA